MTTGSNFPDTRASLLVKLRSSDDDAAWREFVHLYRPVIYRIARRRNLQDADAQDLAQKVLVSVANAIGTWEKRDEKARFRHWLRKVVKNAILKALTRGPKDKAVGGPDAHSLLGMLPESEAGLERDLQLEYRREIYHQAAAWVRSEVTVEAWTVFQLSAIDGRPIQEVATMVGKSIGAAYATRARVMNCLQKAVRKIEKRAE